MKKMLLISCVMLALAASAAFAGSLNINWAVGATGDCYTDLNVANKTFACATNSNTAANVHNMVISFAPTGSHTLIATDVVIDGQTTGTVIPAWWQFKNTGACRINALTNNVAYSGGGASCLDGFGGQGAGGITYYGDPSVPTIPTPMPAGIRARIKATWATPVATASPVDAGMEYFAMNIKVTNEKTVGTGLCAGCLTPMAWVLNSIVPAFNDAGVLSQEVIITPMGNQCLSWQGGAAGLCAATPTQNKTWGQVKSLYR